MADTSNGMKWDARMGNVQQNTSWVLNLPPGDYRWGVQAIDNSFAGSMFAKSWEGPTGISVKVNKLSLNVYPNPSNGEVKLQLPSDKNHEVVVSAIDGREVQKLTARGSVRLQLASGMYMIQAIDADGNAGVEKVLVK
jgi:hypothetical protein